MENKKVLMTIKEAVFGIFQNDSKTYKYLSLRHDLTDEDFIEAARKCRPTNRALLNYISYLSKEIAPVEEVKVEEEEVVEEVGGEFPSYKKHCILDIFKNDSSTLKKLNKNLNLSDDDFSTLAVSCRPTNRALKNLIEAETPQRGITPNIVIMDESNFIDSEVEEVEEVEEEVENPIDDHTDDEMELNIRPMIFDIFKNDKGTIAAFNKHLEISSESDKKETVINEELLTIAIKRRPQNRALNTLIDMLNSAKKIEVQPTFVEVDNREELKDIEISCNSDIVDILKRFPDIKPDQNGVISIKCNLFDESNENSYDEDDYRIISETKNEEMIEKIDVQYAITDIFKNDSKTLTALQKVIDTGISGWDLIKKAVNYRPKNAKLSKLIEDIESNNLEFHEPKAQSKYEEKIKNDVAIKYIRNSNRNITMYIDDETIVINNEHEQFSNIAELLTNRKFGEVYKLIDTRAIIRNFVGDSMEIKNSTILYKGEVLHDAIVQKIVDTSLMNGTSIQPILKFIAKIKKNDNLRSQQELYGFLSSGKIPINERGNIITYKRINADWTDCHSGKIDNSVGNVVMMPRKNVNSNSKQTCSVGLHVCSYSYLNSFSGSKLIACEVNPKDVISIPNDYNNAKMRCCKYKVLCEIKTQNDILALNPIYLD